MERRVKRKMADDKLTVEKVLLIVVATIAVCVPAIIIYHVIVLAISPLIGFYSGFLATAVICVPAALVAYALKRRRR